MGSEALLARTGRQKQRYDNHFRLVSGCIPYKLRSSAEGHEDDLLNRLQVLMISTPNRHDLVFPKGGWEDDETDEAAAHREAWEEAGVKGIIRGELGVWEFKSKSKQNSCSMEGSCRGKMFAMEVTAELPSWPEQAIYQRKWLTVKEAWEICRYDWMREALNKCLMFLSEEIESSVAEKPEPSMAARLTPLRESTSAALSVLCVDGSA